MSDNIIDFRKYYREKLQIPKQVGTIDDLTRLESILEQSKEEIERMSTLFSLKKYSLFLNSLFYNNHATNHDIKAGFLVGFKEDHLDIIENNICKVLIKLNRPFIIVNAKMKTSLRFSENLTNCFFNSMQEASKEIERQFINSDKVFIIRQFSEARIGSKGDHLRYLIKKREKIKFIDDTHFEKMHPDSDLIFIDYANFLQKVWDDIGYYLSILTFSEDGREFIFDSKE